MKTDDNHVQEKPMLVKLVTPSLAIAISSFLSLLIAAISLVISVYTTIHTVGKEKIDVVGFKYIGFAVSDKKQLFLSQIISLKNYGDAKGSISSIEAFIISKARNSHGDPMYMRYFSDVYCVTEQEAVNPFLGCFLYPGDSWYTEVRVYQETKDGFGSFGYGVTPKESIKYEYLLVFRGDKEYPLYYEFTVNESQVRNILGSSGDNSAITLNPIQEQERRDALLKTFNSFKNKPIGDDENDLQFEIASIITFDPNGGTGGNRSQHFLVGETDKLDGGIPSRQGYRFLFWHTDANYKHSAILPRYENIYENGLFTKVPKDITLYAVWEAVRENDQDRP